MDSVRVEAAESCTPLLLNSFNNKGKMRTRQLFTVILLASTAAVGAQTDSARLEQMQEVVVRGVRVQKDAPYAVSNIKKQELQQFSTTTRELPHLFARTPGIVAWSENGVGTGTTYMRIRGAGDSRINVTLDGVPLNSPEDQCVFWANMNSYASLLGSVQIQRGVGTSTNGDGAFGGTIALSTAAPSYTPSGEVTMQYGSFNTWRLGGNFSTGLLYDQLIIDGAYHHTQTDGFLHGTDGKSGSYYGGITWLATPRLTIRYKNIGNYEQTGQAWNGVTAGNDASSLMDGMYLGATGIHTYKDMYDAGLGQYNSLYEQIVYDADNWVFPQNADGTYQTKRYQMADGTLWSRTTDNFWQNHNILSAAFDINNNWTASASLHYTHGYGYYDEFRPNNKLGKKFGINVFDTSGEPLLSDVVRQKGLRQDVYGFVGNIRYEDHHWDIIGGLSMQTFEGNHFGHLTYIKDATVSSVYLANGKYTYYDSDANKNDANIYAKAAYRFGSGWAAFGDIQFRHVGYLTNGVNDKFIKQADGNYTKQLLNISKQYDFLNPKLGLSWTQGPHHAYASFALSHREPERNNFTDNGSYPAPVAESLMDYEAGYTYTGNTWRMGANFYFMDYDNQFVQTGAESDIGEKLTTNVKDSYRMGVELTAGWDITSWLTIEGNAALSSNRINNFDEVVEDWRDKYADDPVKNADAMTNYHIDGDGDGFRTIHHDNSTLAFSPSAILNGFIDFHWKGITAVWHTGYVSRQYLDNSENEDRSLPEYSTSDVQLTYTLPLHRFACPKSIIFGLNINNIFNRRYAANGWVYSAIDEKDGFTPDHRYYQIGFIPSAGTTVMGSLTLKF